MCQSPSRMQVCLYSALFDEFARQAICDLYVPGERTSLFSKCQGLDAFKPLKGSLVVAEVLVKDKNVLLFGKPIINKALQLGKDVHLFLIAPRKVLSAVNSQLGQVRVYGLDAKYVGIYRAVGSLVPPVLSCDEEYDPEKSSIDSTTAENYHELDKSIMWAHVHAPPSLLNTDVVAYHRQPGMCEQSQATGRWILTSVVAATIGTESAFFFMDDFLASLGEGFTYRKRCENALASLAAVYMGFETALFGPALAVKHIQTLLPCLTDAIFLYGYVSYFHVIRNILDAFPNGGCYSHIYHTENRAEFQLELFADACSSFGMGYINKIFKCTSNTVERAAHMACERAISAMGGRPAIADVYLKQQHRQLGSNGIQLEEFKYRMTTRGALPRDHMAFHVAGDNIVSRSYVNTYVLCSASQLSTAHGAPSGMRTS